MCCQQSQPTAPAGRAANENGGEQLPWILPPGSWPACWPSAATWTGPRRYCAGGPTPTHIRTASGGSPAVFSLLSPLAVPLLLKPRCAAHPRAVDAGAVAPPGQRSHHEALGQAGTRTRQGQRMGRMTPRCLAAGSGLISAVARSPCCGNAPRRAPDPVGISAINGSRRDRSGTHPLPGAPPRTAKPGSSRSPRLNLGRSTGHVPSGDAGGADRDDDGHPEHGR